MTGTTFPSGISTRKKYGGTTTATAYQATTKLVRRTAVIRCDAQTSETQTGFTFPTNAIVHEVYLNVITIDATETVDVGTMGTSNDPDGFLNDASIATAGLVRGILATGSETLGALMTEETEAGTTDATIRRPCITAGGDPVSYQCSAGSDTAVFDIIIVYDEVVTEI